MKNTNGEELFLAAIKMLHEKAKTMDGIRLGYCRCHTSDIKEEFKVGEVFKVLCVESGGSGFFDGYSVCTENPSRLINFKCPEKFNEMFKEISKEQYNKILIENRFDL